MRGARSGESVGGVSSEEGCTSEANEEGVARAKQVRKARRAMRVMRTTREQAKRGQAKRERTLCGRCGMVRTVCEW